MKKSILVLILILFCSICEAASSAFISTTLNVTGTVQYLPSSVRDEASLKKVIITVEGGDCRFWVDGTAPTSTVGHLFKPGNTVPVEGINDCRRFQIIRDSSNSGTTTAFITGLWE